MLNEISYYRASNLKELKKLVRDARPPIYFLCGGTDLITQAMDGIIPPSSWIDISIVHELRGIHKNNKNIFIGAATPFTQIAESSVLKKCAPALVSAVKEIGGVQIRNRGTIGGNAGNASPAADSIPALYTLDAQVHYQSKNGKRKIPIEKFFIGPRKTILKTGEFILGFEFPIVQNSVGKFLRAGQRQAQTISKSSVTVSMILHQNKIEWIRIALGAVAPTIVRARKTEEFLIGQSIQNEKALKHAADLVQTEIHPIADVRSTAEYRRKITGVLLRRELCILRS